MAAKLKLWCGKHISITGREVLVKLVLTSLAIYYLTSLVLPAEVYSYIDKLQLAHLWAASDKTSG